MALATPAYILSILINSYLIEASSSFVTDGDNLWIAHFFLEYRLAEISIISPRVDIPKKCVRLQFQVSNSTSIVVCCSNYALTFTLERLTMRNSEGCVFSDGRSVRDLKRFICWSNIISISSKNPCSSCSCTCKLLSVRNHKYSSVALHKTAYNLLSDIAAVCVSSQQVDQPVDQTLSLPRFVLRLPVPPSPGAPPLRQPVSVWSSDGLHVPRLRYY